MKKKLTSILLILISVFAFTSCGDSKEAVVEDMISLMDETTEAMKSEDKVALAEIQEKSKALEERMKTLGSDMKDLSKLPEELQEKYKEAAANMLKATMKGISSDDFNFKDKKEVLEKLKEKIPPSAKLKAKDIIDNVPTLSDSAKELMKEKIDSANNK